MPIKIPDNLPAKEILRSEHVFVMDEAMAFRQDVRPLQIAIMNLMPTKIVTETQLMRLLSNTPLQLEVTLLHPGTYESKNTPVSHMETFYKTFEDVEDRNFDGLIITGAPVENLAFEDVKYWPELCRVMKWSTEHVTTTLHICWGAQAGMYYHYGVPKIDLGKKLFGVYPHYVLNRRTRLMRGFDDIFYVPHSRYTGTSLEDVLKVPDLDVLALSEKAGLCICASHDRRQIYMTGHLEYDRDTLKLEYQRDIQKGLDIAVPENYFPDDDPTRKPYHQWRSHAYLLYANWLNYYVYQATPYDLADINLNFVPDRKGE
ncbi:MAG: homoserine O-succinyltransferase [Clostridia bacterium]|nr:homoserine O-succinyltransferase [Clostridia bacterium]MBQ3867279.1 homoserine O-succinyltransferase [Clostridia bacterium]MBR0158444.1 homoserine O-succinyltransferase [Clostridia bacterium]MBR7062872.1 homoserine O-succinyltransferase [Clostridia bacterium]